MDEAARELLFNLALAGALGLLVGLERERSKATKEQEIAAGARTLPILAIWGAAAAYLSSLYTPWILVASLLGVAGLATANYWWASRKETEEPGLTTPVVVVVTFLLGSLVQVAHHFTPIVIAVAMTTLLAFKPQIHRFARGLSQDHVQSILEFVVLMAIVLPLLPDKTIDPQGAIKPREVGFMVTLIAGIGLAGFLLIKFVGTGRGVRFTAALGGLVSSTALVFSFSRHSQSEPKAAREFGLGIALACSIMFARVLVEVLAVGPHLIGWVAIPMGAMLGAAYLTYRIEARREKTSAELPEELDIRNPTELSIAIKFGVLYAAIRWASAFLSQNMGQEALYLLAIVAGTTDVDAITLSLSRMAGNEVSKTVAAQAITLSAISNTFVKLGLTWFLAHPKARNAVVPILAVAGAAGIVAFFGIGLMG